MEMNLLDKILETCQQEQALVTITLQNKVRVNGKIKAFDNYVIMLDSQKHEIIYRHCISCLTRHTPEAANNAASVHRPSPAAVKTIPRAPKATRHKTHAQPSPKVAVADTDSSINSGMKEGLLKWMQKQKAAK